MTQHIPCPTLAGSCSGQHTQEGPSLWDASPGGPGWILPAGVDSMSAMDRDSIRDIWGAFPLISISVCTHRPVSGYWCLKGSVGFSAIKVHFTALSVCRVVFSWGNRSFLQGISMLLWWKCFAYCPEIYETLGTELSVPIGGCKVVPGHCWSIFTACSVLKHQLLSR